MSHKQDEPALFCLVSWRTPPCSQPAICQLEMAAPSLPSHCTAQPPFIVQVLNEFLIQFWLWNPASYCCLGLAFPFIHHQRIVRDKLKDYWLSRGGFPGLPLSNGLAGGWKLGGMRETPLQAQRLCRVWTLLGYLSGPLASGKGEHYTAQNILWTKIILNFIKM
jgi:hypothetical protein